MVSRLHELWTHGVSVWVDSLSREMLETGELARLIEEDAVVGVTSNPTIFEKALSTGDWYDDQLREKLASAADPKEAFIALAVEDVRRACDLLLPVWERTDRLDGYVSLEVDPDLAYDRDGTYAEAARLSELVDRANLLVKIPATVPGLGAIEDSIAAGRAINVTLIFSLERHAAVAEAYVRGVERLLAEGGDPTRVASVASFFVSRVDTETDRRLAELGRQDLAGKLAVANAKLAYQRYLEVFSGERWDALAAAGATPQRCLWASTSTKNPAYRDVLYVEELIGPATVNTMPLETITAFQGHGICADTLAEGIDETKALLDVLAEADDYEDVVETLRPRASRSSPTRSPRCWRVSTRSAPRSSPERAAGDARPRSMCQWLELPLGLPTLSSPT
jgi:transaldolase